jgi:hypothetical protein
VIGILSETDTVAEPQLSVAVSTLAAGMPVELQGSVAPGGHDGINTGFMVSMTI